MKVELNPELERMIAHQVDLGHYRSADEYIDRAIRILYEEEESLADDRELLREEIALGIAHLDRGEHIPADVSRSRLQQRKAEYLKRTRQS